MPTLLQAPSMRIQGALVRVCVLAVAALCVGGGAYPQSAKAEAWWSVPPANGAIEGYLTKLSTVPGQTVEVRINVPSVDTYRLRVFRLDGSTDGGTEVGCRPTCGVDRRGVAQPAATTDPVTNEIRAPWTTTDTLRVGARWPSGYYAVQFVLTSGPQAGSGAWAPLIVKRAPQRQPAKILLEIPMSTAAAYNEWGGLSAYSGGPWSEVVSLDRPFLNGLLGVQHQGGSLNWLPGSYTVDPAGAAHKWMRGTGLKAGDDLPGLVSVEVDTIPNSFAVVGKTCPSRPVTVLFHREMGGDTLGNADAVTYVARSGARIFSAGSLEFVNGIDDISARMSGGPSFVDRRVQKFVLNMLRGMTGQR